MPSASSTTPRARTAPWTEPPRTTPATPAPKARLAGTTIAGHYRLRFDHVGTNGKISLRRAGRTHHPGVGAAHRGTFVLVLIDETTATVIARRTGEILATCTIDPTRTYWRNNKREPGRRPGSLL